MKQERLDRDIEDLVDSGFREDINGLSVFYQPKINPAIMKSGVKEQDYVDMLQEQKAIENEYLNRGDN